MGFKISKNCVNDRLGRKWNKAVEVYLKLFSKHIPGGTKGELQNLKQISFVSAMKFEL
jgi:hypothetical protein